MERTFAQSCYNLKKIVNKESNLFFLSKSTLGCVFGYFLLFLRFDIQILQSKTKILLSHVSSFTERSDFKKKQKMPIEKKKILPIEFKFHWKTVLKNEGQILPNISLLQFKFFEVKAKLFKYNLQTKQTSMDVLVLMT